MEKNLNKNTLTPLSTNVIGLIPNSVPNEASNITNVVIKLEEMENCSTFEPHLIKVTREHELPQATLIENNIISTSTVKLEPDSNHAKFRRLSGDILRHKWDELKVTVVQPEEKIIPKIQECTWDSSDSISGSNLNGSLEFSSKQLEILKTENSEFKSEIDKWPEVTYNDWKIKNEEVDLKEEDLTEKENKYREFSSKHSLVSTKNDNTETKSETEKWPEVAYNDWITKNEEVDLKEEDLLEISSQSVLPGHCKQEKCDADREFKCHVCDYQTERKSRLKTHLVTHKKLGKVYSFNSNNEYVFRYKGDLKKHTWRHKGPEDLFKCDTCKYVTNFKSALKRHSLRHKNPEEIELFRCNKCDYQTRYKEYLKEHQLRHKSLEEVDLFRCDNCEYQTRFKEYLKKHQLRHKSLEEVDLFKCDKCEYQTYYKVHLKTHQLRHKSVEEVDLFKCDKCEYVTRYGNGMKMHALQHKKLKEVKLLKCDKCEYMTRYKSSLKRHARRHEKPKDLLKCDRCEYVTRYGNGMKMHALQHKKLEEVKLFKCDKCEYMTRYKCSLKRHARRHEKPKDLLKCDRCEYQTHFKDNLRKHFLRHKKRDFQNLRG